MSHYFGLYQLVKTERRIFQCNRNELELALSKRNGSESIYGYKLTNVNIKKVISVSVFLLQNKIVFTEKGTVEESISCAAFILALVWLRSEPVC